jgi:exo-beta-1,3-glucanase (GH17 family)
MKIIVIQVLFLYAFSSFVLASCPNKPVYGICFTPYRQGQLEEDVAIISEVATATRTYGIDHNLVKVPEFCNDYGLDCYVGCWISGNPAEDQDTITELIAIANEGYATTRALIVGNEYVYHHFSDPCSVSYITGLMNQVRAATTIPVVTAEPWDIWFARPALVDAVDFIPIHHYGFLRRFDVNTAVQENIGVYNAIKDRYPNKEIIIFETGWPTQGEVLGSAVPSEENQEQFLKKFIPLAKENNIKYFIFAGFDEPYKEQRSGIVYESHWGLYYENRTIKLGFNSILSANLADIDFDGNVNTIDLEELTIDWLEWTEADALCLPGDLNHDQTINFYDFAELANNWLFSEG